MTPEERALLEQEALNVRQGVVELNAQSGDEWCSDLCGACAVASVLLHRRFRALGFRSRVCLNRDENHCYVIVDSVIFDITATQFGVNYPRVLIGTRRQLSKEHPEDAWIWKAQRTFVREESLNAALEAWPEWQQPLELKKNGLI